MPIWTKETPPKSFSKIGKSAVSTDKGWKDSNTNEILVAIPKLATIAGEANIVSVTFAASEYSQEDALIIKVKYNEYVNVSAGAALQVSWSGVSGNFAAVAAEQLSVAEVQFAAAVPAEAGELSIAEQSIVGTIVDSNDGITASELQISLDLAAAAGVIEVI